MHTAVMRGHSDVLRVLIEYGAPPISTSRPAMVTCVHTRLVLVCIQAYTVINGCLYEILDASAQGHADILRVAFDYDAVDVNTQGIVRCTLHCLSPTNCLLFWWFWYNSWAVTLMEAVKYDQVVARTLLQHLYARDEVYSLCRSLILHTL